MICLGKIKIISLQSLKFHFVFLVQIAVIFDCLEEINKEKVVNYILSLRLDNGSFMGDKCGEVDNRFTFCAVACLALLGNIEHT